MRAVAPSSPSGRREPGDRGRSVSSGGGSGWGRFTTNSGSRPLSRNSTEPGASSQVISSAAAARASCRARRMADSSGANSRSACALASSPPASAAAANCLRMLSTYSVNSMAP